MADEQDNPSVKLHGVVDKIVPVGDGTEKAQIVIQEAEDLYKEIRIDNELQDGGGAKMKMKRGTEVDVTVEASDDGVDNGTEEEKKKSA